MSDQNECNENHKNDSSKGSNSFHHLSTSTTTKSTTTASVSNFPAKLHFMLNELQRDGLEYIASWQQHGRCFIVRNPKEFENTILPCYFQQSKFTSFQRQLSFYGFRRIVSGRDKGGYFHGYFLRGQEELANKIRRTKIKGTGPRKPNSMEAPVPNFYEMTFLTDDNKKNLNLEKKEEFETVKDVYTYSSHGSSMKTFQSNVPEDIASSATTELTEDDDKSLTCIRNQELLHQLQRLNEIDRDLQLLSRATYNVQNYVQARESCQANLRGMCSTLSPGVSCSTPTWKGYICPSQSSILGLNYPLAMSSRTVPLSSLDRTATMVPMGVATPLSSNTSDILMCAALTKYLQQRSNI